MRAPCKPAAPLTSRGSEEPTGRGRAVRAPASPARPLGWRLFLGRRQAPALLGGQMLQPPPPAGGAVGAEPLSTARRNPPPGKPRRGCAAAATELAQLWGCCCPGSAAGCAGCARLSCAGCRARSRGRGSWTRATCCSRRGGFALSSAPDRAQALDRSPRRPPESFLSPFCSRKRSSEGIRRFVRLSSSASASLFALEMRGANCGLRSYISRGLSLCPAPESQKPALDRNPSTCAWSFSRRWKSWHPVSLKNDSPAEFDAR